MKKILLAAGLLVSAFGSKAQYFQRTYAYSTKQNVLTDGIHLKSTDPGALMVGYTDSDKGNELYVVKANIDGQSIYGSPYFNLVYRLYEGTNQLNIKESKVIEFKDGSGYAIAGWYEDPGTMMQGIYYIRIATVGNVITIKKYPVNYSAQAFRMGSLRESLNGEYVYITGSVFNPNLRNYDVFVQKVDHDGSLSVPGTWSVTYNLAHYSFHQSDEMAWDVMESPYNPYVLVVGGIKDVNGGPGDGFVLRLNNSDGLKNTLRFYGDISSDDEFRSINPAFSPVQFTGVKGFVLGGSSNATPGGDYDFWLYRMHYDLTPYTSLSYDNAEKPGENNYCNQIIERRNTAGNYEYYATGYTENGYMGDQDVMVIMQNEQPGGLIGGQYTYGAKGDQRGIAIDQDNGGAADGLYIFNTNEGGSLGTLSGSNFYFVKSYFNGYSGCNEHMEQKLISSDIPSFIDYGDVTNKNYMYEEGLNIEKMNYGQEDKLCFDYTLPGGDNQLQAKTKDAGLATRDKQMVTVSPNPVPAASNIHLNVTAPAGTVEVIVADYMGREYINQRFDIREGGEQTLAIELGKANLAPGIYLLKVNGLDKPATQVLVVK